MEPFNHKHILTILIHAGKSGSVNERGICVHEASQGRPFGTNGHKLFPSSNTVRNRPQKHPRSLCGRRDMRRPYCRHSAATPAAPFVLSSVIFAHGRIQIDASEARQELARGFRLSGRNRNQSLAPGGQTCTSLGRKSHEQTTKSYMAWGGVAIQKRNYQWTGSSLKTAWNIAIISIRSRSTVKARTLSPIHSLADPCAARSPRSRIRLRSNSV